MTRDLPYRIASFFTVLFPLWILMGNAPPDIAMSTIAVMFLVQSAAAGDWRWCRQPWVICMGLLWFYMIARGALADQAFRLSNPTGFADSPYEALRRALPFGRYFVFAAALAYWLLPEPNTNRTFFRLLRIAVFALAVDCILQWFLKVDIIGRPVLPDPGGHVRLTGPYRSPMPGIILAWLSFLAFLPQLMTAEGQVQSGSGFRKGVAYCLCVLAAIALTGERMALIFTLAGWVLAILLLPSQRRALLGLFATMLVTLGVVAFATPAVLTRQGASTVHTLTYWHHSPYGMLLDTDLRLAAQHPLFGAGTNYFRFNCPTLYPGLDKPALAAVCNIHPHNIYLEWLIDDGVIGLGLFTLFIAFVFLACKRAWPEQRTNPYFIAALIAFSMRAWPFASSTNFTSPFGAPPFWLVTGLLMFYAAGAVGKEEAPPISRL